LINVTKRMIFRRSVGIDRATIVVMVEGGWEEAEAMSIEGPSPDPAPHHHEQRRT